MFVFPDCEPNDNKSFLQTQRKQDAEKEPSHMQSHTDAKVLNLFIYLFFFSCDLNDKFLANLSTVIELNDENFSLEEFMIYLA